MKSRIKPVDGATRDNPPPNTYHPHHRMTEQSKFTAITFGFGNRVNVTGKVIDTPGPGTYKISSVFDRFKRLPTKQYMMLKQNGGLLQNKNVKQNDMDNLESKQSEYDDL